MTTKSICVVDFGTGNLRSVAKALERVGGDAVVTVSNDPATIRNSERLVLPGQGAIGSWMRAFNAPKLEDTLTRAIESRPVLGICVGLQALYAASEEDGGAKGLGILQGRVVHFRDSAGDAILRKGLKVPHMGWNRVRQSNSHPLWSGIEDGSRFYFVHSYHPWDTDATQTMGRTEFGVSFDSAAAAANVFAVQFHPEKSAATGLRLLANFVEWDGAT